PFRPGGQPRLSVQSGAEAPHSIMLPDQQLAFSRGGGSETTSRAGSPRADLRVRRERRQPDRIACPLARRTRRSALQVSATLGQKGSRRAAGGRGFEIGVLGTRRPFPRGTGSSVPAKGGTFPLAARKGAGNPREDPRPCLNAPISNPSSSSAPVPSSSA